MHDNHHEDPTQLQAQLEGQGQLQGQGQLEGQGQLQGQGQGEAQGQGQHQSQSSWDANLNGNGNGNLNGNGNGNLNGNGNFNADANLNANLDANHNANANFDANGNLNLNTNVNTDIASSTAIAVADAVSNGVTQGGLIDFANLDLGHLSGGLFNIVDNNSQSGQFNFNLDQVNSLVANNYLDHASVSYEAGSSGSSEGHDHSSAPGFSMTATIDGAGNHASAAANAGDLGTAGTASVSTALTQSAFTQNIVMGANIQFNSLTLTNVGGDSSTSTSVGAASDHMHMGGH